jgi:hypothetical protein
MNSNPYAPPTAHVEDVHDGGVAPPLWNPNGAACWSLLFSPAFGAWLHMRNWQALGEPGKAATSKTWLIATLALLLLLSLVSVLAPDSKVLGGASRSANLILLLAWYFGSGRAQARYVKERFGTSYPRKGWSKPLLIALGVVFTLVAVLLVLIFSLGLPVPGR